jgi:nucleoside-diphosphate-sugar epimerase
MSKKRVLITGAAGRIGASMAEQLRDRYDLRLHYHRNVPEKPPVDDVVRADIADYDQIAPALEGMDAVVHLAGEPAVDTPWDRILKANIAGCHNVYEAARQHKVPKLVFASSNHASGWYEKEGAYVTPEMPVRPDSDYGISKAFGEAVGRYYVDAFGMSVICLRIGSFQARPRNLRHVSTWLSERDCAQLVWRSIESDVDFAVVYGISGNKRGYWDLSSARELLGYEPEDDGERFAHEFEATS